MGFSGGGSNILKSHRHDGLVVQDGGSLDFNNITQSNSSAGEVFYSDGTHLQQLAYPGVPNGEIITAAAASVSPSWATPAAGAAGSMTLIDYTQVGATTTTIDTTFTNIPGDEMSELYVVCAGSNGGNSIDVQVRDESGTLLTGSFYSNAGFHITGGVQTLVNTTLQNTWECVTGSVDNYLAILHISLGFGGGAGANLYPRMNALVGGSYGVSHIGGSYVTGAPRATGISGIKFGTGATNAIENGSYMAVYQVKNV
jgi:hypothetical protein